MYYKIKRLNNFIKVMTVTLLISLSSVGYSQEKDVNILVRKLKDEDQTVRWKAVQTLRKMGTSAIEFLITALKDKDAAVRENAAYALGEIKDARAVNVLLTALKDKRLDIIAFAYAFFIRRGIPETEGLLIEGLNKYGSADMVEDFLGCGNSKLEEAAYLWAKQNGYTLRHLPGGKGKPVWGQEK